VNEIMALVVSHETTVNFQPTFILASRDAIKAALREALGAKNV
jgi:hypothetical protein